MGHRQPSYLPPSKRWRDVVRELGSFTGDEHEVAQIVSATTEGLREAFDKLARDPTLNAAYRFLTALSVAAKARDPHAVLAEMGISVPERPTPLSLAKALRDWMPPPKSPEHAALVERAAIATIGEWTRQASDPLQGKLFAGTESPFDPWAKASDAAGFCRVSRIFFGFLTERYLSYFLDREASSAMGDIGRRKEFAEAIERHVDRIAEYSFEAARITQSFAAGWFNNNALDEVPSSTAVRGFLWKSLGKMREELRREAERR